MNNGNNPYSTGIANKNISHSLDSSTQMPKYKDDERAIAPPILPHELNEIIEVLGNTFVSLAQLRQMLKNASASDSIDQLGVNKIVDKIDTVNEIILAIPEDLDILKI